MENARKSKNEHFPKLIQNKSEMFNRFAGYDFDGNELY